MHGDEAGGSYTRTTTWKSAAATEGKSRASFKVVPQWNARRGSVPGHPHGKVVDTR